MSKTAVSEAQPDLLGAPAPKPTPPKAKATPAKVAKPKAAAKPPGTAVARAEPQKPVAAPAGAPPNMLAIIANAVRDPACDVGKMRALLDMQQEIQREEARRDFTADYLALQAEMPSIKADGKIEVRKKGADGERTGSVQQSTPYATFQNMWKVVQPLLKKHHFTMSFSTEPTPDGSRLIVNGFLDHIGGHRRETKFPLPAETSGSKNNVQGWGSSFSYGKRYAMMALLNIVSHHRDDADLDGGSTVDAESVELVSKKQAAELVEAIKDCGITEAKFCETYEIDRVADLPASQFESAKKRCAKTKELRQ